MNRYMLIAIVFAFCALPMSVVAQETSSSEGDQVVEGPDDEATDGEATDGEADTSIDGDAEGDGVDDGEEDEDVAEGEDGEDEEELYASADRPSFSAGTFTVPPAHVQFELGADIASTDGGAVLTVPQLLIRAGVSEVAELRLGVPSYSAGLGVDDPGAGTTEFSLKVAGNVSDDLSIGVLPYVRFFDYADRSPYGETSLGFLGLWAYSLTDSFGLFGNAGLAAVPGEETPTTFELAVSLGGALALSSSFSLYAEAFLTQAEDGPNVGFGAGPSYSVTPWLALDAYVGAGAAGDFPDLFGGLGVTLIQ